jgi:hypothetical protein
VSSVAFVLDAPTTLAPQGEGDQGPITSEHPVARLGEYKDRRYGEFAITRMDFASWVRNMRELQNGRIPIDYDHGPEETGHTEAAGWIVGLALRQGADIDLEGVDPDAEYAVARIEWTDKGAEAVRERRYLFVSPTFSDNATNEQQEATGPYLHGVALTNRPFLRRGMPAISLSADTELEVAVPVAGGPIHRTVPETKTLRAALKLDDTVSDDDVIAAAAERLTASPDTTPTEDTRTLKERAEAEGLTVLTAAEAQALRDTADKGAEALKQLTQSRFDTAFTKALQAGRVDAKDETRERYQKLYDAEPDTTIALLDSLPVTVKLTTNGSDAGDASKAPDNTDPERYDLLNRALALQADDKTLSYTDAVLKASREVTA